MPVDRRSLARALGWLIAAAALAYAVRSVAMQWDAVRAAAASLQPRWSLLGLASALVLVAYAVLIDTWRRLLHAWEIEIAFHEAARLWLVSSLARYLPGAGLQIGALGILARDRGISGVAAASAAIVNTLLNIATGVGVVAVFGGRALVGASGGRLAPWSLVVTAVGAVVGLAALVMAAPRLAAAAARATGRTVDVARVPARLIALAAVGNVVAWLLYGIAFRTLSASLFGPPTGASGAYVAVYTASYLWGLFAFAVPAGIGAQEFALSLLTPPLAGLPLAQTAILIVAARLWRTVLETAPAALLLVSVRWRRRPTSRSVHGPL